METLSSTYQNGRFCASFGVSLMMNAGTENRMPDIFGFLVIAKAEFLLL